MSGKTYFRLFLVLVLGAGLCLGKEDGGQKKKKEKGNDKQQQAVENKEEGPALGPVLGGKEDSEEDLFKDFPLPEKRPKLAETIMDSARKRYSELADLYDDLGVLIREKELLTQETDEKQARKNRREIEKLDKKIAKQKKELVKAAKKLRRPLDRKMEGYLKEKDDHDKKVESAEKGGNEKRAQKMAQEFARKGPRIEDTQTQIDSINYFLFWDEFMK